MSKINVPEVARTEAKEAEKGTRLRRSSRWRWQYLCSRFLSYIVLECLTSCISADGNLRSRVVSQRVDDVSHMYFGESGQDAAFDDFYGGLLSEDEDFFGRATL